MREPVASPIEYAPPEPLGSKVRRRLKRWLFFVTLASVAYLILPAGLERAKVMYWHHRCLNYSAAPDSIVSGRPGVNAVPREWSRLYELISPPGLSSEGTVFLHRRSGADASTLLVAVDVINSDRGNFELLVRVFNNSGGLPVQIQSQGVPFRAFDADTSLSLRFFAGQPDPINPSHFVIKYQVVGGSTQIVDGWVRYHNWVELERRIPTPPPPP